MKIKTRKIRNLAYAITLCFNTILFASEHAISQTNQNSPLAQPAVISPRDKIVISTFETRVQDYLKLRNELKAKAPKLSKDSTPEQIHAYRTNLEEALRAARAGA